MLNRGVVRFVFGVVTGLAGCAALHAQAPVTPPVDPGLDIPYPRIGGVEPRHASEIAASNWSIGGETLDRDYADYDAYKRYLGPLGAKQIRLQGGWAKTERQKGVYDFAWLDRIVDDAIAQGVDPWLQTSYGNPIYPGGGEANLGGGAPRSPEALEAWDRWVLAMAKRYNGRVNVWEIWNEPDIRNGPDSLSYAKLFERTAEIIRDVNPEATIYALSIANPGRLSYIAGFLDYLKERDKLDLVDQITFHGYMYNPDESYERIARLTELVNSYSPDIVLRQGEQGAPSENQPILALRNYDWTDTSQAKWALRRLLGDLGRDIPSLYFQISDMWYKPGPDAHAVGFNTKGLLQIDSTLAIVRVRPSYQALQHLTSIFDHTLERIPGYAYTTSIDTTLQVFGYRKEHTDEQAVTIWKGTETPGNTNEKVPVDFVFPAGRFTDPVYIDLRTGEVYEIPENTWSRNGSRYEFRGVPIYDSPILIADRSLVELEG